MKSLNAMRSIVFSYLCQGRLSVWINANTSLTKNFTGFQTFGLKSKTGSREFVIINQIIINSKVIYSNYAAMISTFERYFTWVSPKIPIFRYTPNVLAGRKKIEFLPKHSLEELLWMRERVLYLWYEAVYRGHGVVLVNRVWIHLSRAEAVNGNFHTWNKKGNSCSMYGRPSKGQLRQPSLTLKSRPVPYHLSTSPSHFYKQAST